MIPSSHYFAASVWSDQVSIALISALSAFAVAFLAYKGQQKVNEKKKADAPKDRMETIFDGYEKLIVQQQEEITRKGGTIKSLETAVTRLEQELDDTRALLAQAREELAESRDHNADMKKSLEEMKAAYKSAKPLTSKP